MRNHFDSDDSNDRLRQSEARLRFILGVSDALQSLEDPVEIQGTACRLVAEALDVDRAHYVEVDEAAGIARVDRDFVRNDAPSLSGEHRVADFGWSVEILRSGECHVIDDVRTSAVVPVADRPASLALGIVSCMGAPVFKDGTLVGALCVTASCARNWSQAEVAVLRDVADRIWGAIQRARAKAALRTSEARYRALFDAIDEGACLYERLPLRPDGLRDYRYITMNRAMQAMFGIPDLSGRSIRDNFPDEAEDWYDDYDRVLETGEPIRTVRESEPQGMVLEAFVNRVEFNGGNVLLAVMKDVTARVRAEEALRTSERRLRNVLDGMEEAFGLMDHEFRILAQNAAALRLAGRPLEEILGRTHWEAYPGTEDSEIGRLYRRALAEQVPVSMEHCYEWPDGSGSTWLDMHAYPVPEGLAVFWRDITARKAAEAALRETQERQTFMLRLSDALRPLADPVRIKSTAARMVAGHLGGNRAHYAEVDSEDFVIEHGFHADGLPPMPERVPMRLWGKAVLEQIASGITVAIDDVRTNPLFEGEDVSAYETVGFVSGIAVPLIKDGAWKALMAITNAGARAWTEAEVRLAEEVAERTWAAVERARADERLRHSEQRLRLAQQAAGVATFDWEIASQVVTWSPEALRMLGLREGALGGTFEDWIALIHPDDLKRATEQIDMALEYGELEGEWRIRRADGAVAHMFVRGVIERDAEGQPVRLTGAQVDVTDRVRSEEAIRLRFDYLSSQVEELRRRLGDDPT